MNKPKKTLLVGCGGSGIKTIINFNRLMAGDADCRNRLWEDVSYLIVDTDEEDIAGFEKQIDGVLRSSDADRSIAPAMKTVHITRNTTILNDVIQKKIVPVKDPEKRAVLEKNWWFSPGGEPYRAIHSRDCTAGAAQCPAISYMAVWNYLPTLEKNINALLDEISARSSSEDWSLNGLRVFLIAGTSGGTGRGTWNLVSFKLRECIQRRLPNAEIDIPAIFIDSSCYRGNTKSDDFKTFSKTVNSLTALSELSAWLALRDEMAYSYSLPPLSSPRAANGTERATDIIRVDASSNDPYQQSPLRYAYLVFGSNGTVKLACRDGGVNEYCEMAGAALFALVAQAPQFRSDAANSLPKYCSFAAATAEVETVKLRKYFESALRRSKIKGYCGDMGEEEVERYGESLMKSFGFRQTLPVDENFLDANCGSGELSKDAQFVSRLFSRLMGGALKGGLVLDADQLVGEDGFFAEQDLGSVCEQITAKFDHIKGSLTPGKVAQAVDSLLQEDSLRMESALKGRGVNIPVPREFTDPIRKMLWLQVVNAFQDGPHPSVTRMSKCLAILTDKVGEFVSNLGEIPEDDGLESLLELCDKYAHNQGLRFWADIFDEQEQRAIAEQFVMSAKRSIYRFSREVLLAKFNEVKNCLEIWSNALEGALDALKEASDFYYEAGNEECTGSKVKSAFRELFIDKDMESVDKSIPPASSSSSVVRRIIRPIMSRQEVCDLLCDKDMSVCDDGALSKAVVKSIGAALVKGTDFGRDDIDSMCDGFVHLFGNGVRVKQEHLYAEFTLQKVLERNVSGWNDLLKNKASSGNLDELQDRLRAFLGVSQHVKGDYAGDGSEPRLKLAKIKQRLPESLVRNCIPWIVFDDDESIGKANLQTTLLIPFEMLPIERSACEAAVTHDGETDVNVIDKSMPKGAGIPLDCMIAYSSIFVPVEGIEGHPFDHIVSLKQDMADPRVMEALVRAESRDALGYFSLDEQTGKYRERPRGLGFVSPVFLGEPELSSRRWKPWQRAVEKFAERKAKEGRALEAIVYALSGVDLKSNSTALATFRRAHWEFPLLARKTAKSNKFKFMREAYRLDNGAVAAVADPKWTKGAVLDVNGVAELVDYLNGKGLKDENGVIVPGSKAEGSAVLKQLVSEMDLFKAEIVGKFAVSAWKKIADERYAWIKSVANRKERMPARDREVWLKLVVVADANRVR